MAGEIFHTENFDGPFKTIEVRALWNSNTLYEKVEEVLNSMSAEGWNFVESVPLGNLRILLIFRHSTRK